MHSEDFLPSVFGECEELPQGADKFCMGSDFKNISPCVDAGAALALHTAIFQDQQKAVC